jgi:magnesium chelatase subunit I
LPEDIETGGIDEVCPDCARKYGEGETLVYRDSVQLIELPLNAKLEDVIGGLDSRTGEHHRHRLRRGILSRADRNLLYIDEVNMLDDEIVDAILDAASQGAYTVRRGSFAATYRSRFVLIGSMNPEEGRLRPQILDRFGLRVLVSGLKSKKQRLEAYQRTIAYRTNPRQVVREYANATALVRAELQGARDTMSKVTITKEAERYGLDLIKEMGVDSLRAEISLFEAARARAVSDGRQKASTKDIRAVAPIAIRLRRSEFMDDFFKAQRREQRRLEQLLKQPASGSDKKSRTKS